MGVEQFYQFGKVGQRPGQAINLVDENHIDQAGSDIFQEFLKGRAG